MGYVRRTSLPNGYFHLWARGVDGIPPFPAPEDRTAALGMLMSAGHRFGVRFIAVTVMTTHWHAVAAGETSKISRAIQWFHSRYARAFNRRYERFGHVFAERFKCKTVEEDGVRDRCGYVLGNPVKAGLCDRIADWPWSWCRYGLDTF